MQDRSKFIGNHPTTSYHPHVCDGTANSVYRNNVKFRRTYGWDCPFDVYKSNKWFNVQRHINLIHGWGSGVPLDGRTGETMEDKRKSATLQRNFQNTLAPSYSHSDSFVSTGPDTEFEGNTCGKENQSASPAALLSPAHTSKIRMPFLESQEKRVRQLGYGPPPSGLRDNYHGQSNKLTPFYEQNAYFSRARNDPNALKPQDGKAWDWNRLDLNGLHGTQENLSTNSLTTYPPIPSVPVNPQNFPLVEMQILLALFK